jgi:hypothetical protein
MCNEQFCILAVSPWSIYDLSEFLKSPSPTYDLPPSTDAMARVQAMQSSPVPRQSRAPHDPRASIFIDNEAAELQSRRTRNIYFMNPEISGESSLSSS